MHRPTAEVAQVSRRKGTVKLEIQRTVCAIGGITRVDEEDEGRTTGEQIQHPPTQTSAIQEVLSELELLAELPGYEESTSSSSEPGTGQQQG